MSTYNAGIVGRDILVPALEHHLRAAPGGCLGLWGMRGLGKTTLVKALCSSLQGKFPGRTCLLSFPSVEAAARGVNLEQLQLDLVSAALCMLGIQKEQRTSAEQVSYAIGAD